MLKDEETKQFIKEKDCIIQDMKIISKESMLVLGKALGFPKCCTTEFVDNFDDLPNFPPRKLNGTGYIPCKNCNENNNEQELINEINAARAYKYTFPTKHIRLSLKDFELDRLSNKEQLILGQWLNKGQELLEISKRINENKSLSNNLLIVLKSLLSIFT